MSETTPHVPAIMIALRIKGFAKAPALSETLDLDLAGVETALAELEADGLAAGTKLGTKLTDAGKAAADAASKAEHDTADDAALSESYDAFCALNGPFKALMADWQTKILDGERVPNDHADEDYDAGILASLRNIHSDTLALCDRLEPLAPRLSQYRHRFTRAMARLENGETRYFAAPLIDSYHTAWFELHEDLIRLTGRTRAAEALAGRAV